MISNARTDVGKPESRVAIVTSAARGLVEATARAQCIAGAAVMLTDILPEVEETDPSLRREGLKAASGMLDVSSSKEREAVVTAARAQLGDVAILVNNASITFNATFEDVSLEQYQKVHSVDLLGSFLGMKAVLPSMKRTGHRAIINIASTTAEQILWIVPCCGSSKAALANLTKSAALHCAEQDYNIRINSLHPGTYATPMILNAGMAAELPQAKAIINAIPMKRMGHPSEVYKVVVFLASDNASYITGADLFVDGGAAIA